MPALGAASAAIRIARRTIGPILISALLAAPAAGAEYHGSTRTVYTDAGLFGLTVTNLGYVGDGFDSSTQPSGEYRIGSKVEHLYLGGIWVGALTAGGTRRVSTGAQDVRYLQDGDEINEFVYFYDQPGEGEAESPETFPENYLYVWSNLQNSDDYDTRALSTQQIQAYMTDYAQPESGDHVPLGLKVILRALAWGDSYADDFVILDYAIVNVSGTELRDVYLGFWADTAVGNTEHTVPEQYDPGAPVRWNWYDDVNGAFGPAEWVGSEYAVPDDPDIWMLWEHDDDGEEGLATTWVGCRLLGTRPAVAPPAGQPPVSYNTWRHNGVPAEDDTYEDDFGETRPGKYQIMSNGDFDVGADGGTDFTVPANWNVLLSTGPVPYVAAGDTIHVTFAIVGGDDEQSLLANSKVAQVAYDSGFAIPTGPPSPRLDVSYDWNRIRLRWAPGDSLDAAGDPLPADDSRRSPEQHISTITNEPDFQGYRIFRYQGTYIDQDPYELSTLVAEFDKIDGVGFDTGLPPLTEDGRREFVDEDLLDGFPYWYSVVSFSAPNIDVGLPSFQSGFNENAVLLFPGPAATGAGDGSRVGVAPNPYRAGSQFDDPLGEVELGRRIWFVNLPARCTIKIYTLAGDLVRTLDHDDPVEGKLAWDVLSEYGRVVATGLYVYAVTDLDSGEIQRGKLVIIK